MRGPWKGLWKQSKQEIKAGIVELENVLKMTMAVNDRLREKIMELRAELKVLKMLLLQESVANAELKAEIKQLKREVLPISGGSVAGKGGEYDPWDEGRDERAPEQ